MTLNFLKEFHWPSTPLVLLTKMNLLCIFNKHFIQKQSSYISSHRSQYSPVRIMIRFIIFSQINVTFLFRSISYAHSYWIFHKNYISKDTFLIGRSPSVICDCARYLAHHLSELAPERWHGISFKISISIADRALFSLDFYFTLDEAR